MQSKINVMLIMTRERRVPLLEVLESCGIDVLQVCDCSEARRVLKAQRQMRVVVTDTPLPDGDWQAVLEIVAHGCPNAEVVVCSRLGDPKLWIDVLEQGAYDVLVEPYEREEIRRILEVAASRSYMRSLPPTRATSHEIRSVSATGAALAGMRSS